jgi:hypothetical protein
MKESEQDSELCDKHLVGLWKAQKGCCHMTTKYLRELLNVVNKDCIFVEQATTQV